MQVNTTGTNNNGAANNGQPNAGAGAVNGQNANGLGGVNVSADDEKRLDNMPVWKGDDSGNVTF